MMTHFFDSTESIAEGLGFPLFGFGHLCWLAAFVVFAVVCSRIYKKSDAAKRQRIRYIFVVLLLLDEAIKVIGLSVQGLFEPQYLPFHLCSINIFIILWHCKHQNNALNNYLFIVGIPAGMIALLTPSWTVLPFWNFMNIHSFTVHILLATYPIMLTYSGETNPQLKYLPGSLGVLAALACVAYGMNLIFDTNFMFLMYAHPGTPLVWFAENWGSHFLGFPVLISAIAVAMYTGVFVYRKITTRP
jgi:hypothetical integral membrane protein (TIGR02206 family)